MNDVLKKLNELVAICEVRVKKVNEQGEKNLRDKVALDKRSKEVEDANKLAVEGLARLNALKVKHEDLANAKKAKKELDLEIKRYKGMIAVLEEERKDVKKLNKDAEATIEARKQKFQKEIEKLNEDKKDFKLKVMESISEELKKKGIELWKEQ